MRFLRLLALLYAFLFSFGLFAAQELVVEERVPVFRKMLPNQKPVLILKPGQVVALADEVQDPKWRKVFIEHKSKVYPLWIQVKYLKKSRIRFGTDNSNLESQASKNRSRWGFTYQFVSTYMGEQNVKDSDGLGASFETMKGSSSFPGFFYQQEYTEVSSFRYSLFFANYYVMGEGKYDASPSSTEVEIDQEFISAQIAYVRYIQSVQGLWWALGAQMDKGTAVNLSIGSKKEELSGSALPIYGGIVLQMGYDYSIAEDWHISPQLSLLYVFNADKKIIPAYFSFALSKDL